MKRFIYSIIAALILSAILTLLIPKWGFKGDACWTYKNDAARVDVRFSGHLKNGRAITEGTDLRVSQPAWLSNENYQGTMVEVPVSYQNKSCRVKITPKADAWGEDAVLIIELKGKNFQHRGKRRPAWVCFRNVTLNGQPVAAEKLVWHDKPFLLKYPHHASEMTLTFDICKPFAASDISYANIFVIFVVFLLLNLFLSPLKRVAARALIFTNRKDIVKMVSDGYGKIDPVYRRSFWIIFGVLCFAFGLHAIWFMWGNHDWAFLDSRHQWLEQAWTGRYMKYLVKVLLSNGVYLPLIHDLIIFLTLAINAILLCRYWCLAKCVTYYVLCGLVLTAQPFTLSMLYFVDMTPEVFIGVTCTLVALILSESIATRGGAYIKKIAYALISIVLLNFALATYPVLINTITVAFMGKLLVQALNWDGSRQRLQACMRMFMISAINIVLGIMLYKLITTFVFPIRAFYNTDTLPLHQVPERLAISLRQSVSQLYEYNPPFLHQWTLWIFLGLTIVLVLYVCSIDNFKQKVVRLALLFGSLFATQTAMTISRTHFVAGRVELFGLVFFEILVMSIVMTKFRRFHNLWVIIGTCIIIASVISDMNCLRVWKLGFDAEKMLWNRILTRLETTKGFEIGKKYDVVQIGYAIPLRSRYYTQIGIQTNSRDNALLNFAFDPDHAPFNACQFYYPISFLSKKQFGAYHGRNPGYIKRLRHLYQAGVLKKAEVWPKPNGLIVWKDIILFVTDGKALDNYKKRFERELGKK